MLMVRAEKHGDTLRLSNSLAKPKTVPFLVSDHLFMIMITNLRYGLCTLALNSNPECGSVRFCSLQYPNPECVQLCKGCFKFKSRLDQLSAHSEHLCEPHLTVLDGGLPCLTSFLILPSCFGFSSLKEIESESETANSSISPI